MGWPGDRRISSIRAAAIAAFHGRGLGTPWRRSPLPLGSARPPFTTASAAVRASSTRSSRSSSGPRCTRSWTGPGSPYRQPAAVDVHLMTYADSAQVAAQWNAGRATGIALVQQAHQACALRADFTADDLYQALVANGLALRHRPKPNREDYDRRGRFFPRQPPTAPLTCRRPKRATGHPTRRTDGSPIETPSPVAEPVEATARPASASWIDTPAPPMAPRANMGPMTIRSANSCKQEGQPFRLPQPRGRSCSWPSSGT